MGLTRCVGCNMTFKRSPQALDLYQTVGMQRGANGDVGLVFHLHHHGYSGLWNRPDITALVDWA